MAYTPIITKADITRFIYQENLDLVTRGDDTIIDAAISAAIAKVKMYLNRYDLTELFGSEADGTSATFEDENLKGYCIDVALWQVLKLGVPNVDSERIRQAYDDAIKELIRIQDGKSNPEGWPYKDTTGTEAPPGLSVKFKSKTKRNNDF